MINYSDFLSRHDPTWSVRPLLWDDSAFLGNGEMGCTILSDEHKSLRGTWRFVMGRTDITCRRPGQYAVRVPVGEWNLTFSSWIDGGSFMRLSLYDAMFISELTTVQGKARVRAFMPRDTEILILEISKLEQEHYDISFVPYCERSAALQANDGSNADQYLPETQIQRLHIQETDMVCQIYNHSSDGCTAAWRMIQTDTADYIYCTLLNGHDENTISQGLSILTEAVNTGFETLLQNHLRFWHAYYEKSFISIPDTRLEGFYWIQMYKLACLNRPGAPIMDNQGPWTRYTPWPGTWFNMNVQLAYSPVYTSNHLDMGMTLFDTLRKQLPQLIRNVPQEWQTDSAGLGRSMSHDLNAPVEDETGNLLWTLHCCYLLYRYSMDDSLLPDFTELLHRAVHYHLHLLQEGNDGYLHLPPTISPEYGSFRKLKVADCNYDLFLLRWGIITLLQLQSPESDMLNAVLERLVPYPVDETGFMLGHDVSLTSGHRHFSHLLGIHPLHILDLDNPDIYALCLQSLRHWLSLEGDLRGFSWAGAASIAAALGLGDIAYRCILSALSLFKPNTFYAEAGPVIESPLATAAALQDLLLQSHGGLLRIAPAIPEDWDSFCFYHLLAEGAFLVSAIYQKHHLVRLDIESLAGEPLQIVLPQDEILYHNNTPLHFQKGIPKALPLDAGQTLSLLQNTEAAYAPIEGQPWLFGFWGGNKPWRMYGMPMSFNE